MSLTFGVDFSFARPGWAAIKAAGFDFVIRYLPYQGDGGKGATKEEIDEYRANGLSVGFVFESTAGRMFEGAPAGEYDAAIALIARAALGIPDHVPTYFACDVDTTPETVGYIDSYFTGVARTMPSILARGVYGENDVIEHCHDRELCAWFWQTYAWSGGALHPYRHILQYSNGQKVGGADVDYNEAYGVAGLWEPESEAPVADPPIQQSNLAVGQRVERIERILAGWGFLSDEGEELSGEDAVAYIDKHERSLYKGLLLLQIAVAGDEQESAAAIAELRGLIAAARNQA